MAKGALDLPGSLDWTRALSMLESEVLVTGEVVRRAVGTLTTWCVVDGEPIAVTVKQAAAGFRSSPTTPR